MAYAIEPVSPTLLSISAADEYVEVDVSEHVASGAVGIFIEAINDTEGAINFYVRKNGSTDDLNAPGRSDNAYLAPGKNSQLAVGLDANGVFEIQTTDTNLKVYLVAYVPEGGGVFETNLDDVTPGTTGSYQEVDLSGYSGDDSVGLALFYHIVNSTGRQLGMREKGSTDDYYEWLGYNVGLGRWVTADSNDIVEVKVNDEWGALYFVGFIKASVFNKQTNAVEYSIGYVDSWRDVTISELDANCPMAVFLIFEAEATSDDKVGYRKNGSAYDNYRDLKQQTGCVCEVDGDKVMEIKVETRTYDGGYKSDYRFYLLGWPDEMPAPAPVADFSAEPTSGELELAVQFTDLSTNDPTSWLWDFGDESTSEEQSPEHTYTEAGTYTVKLTATNDGGSDEEEKVDYITVTAPPPEPEPADVNPDAFSGYHCFIEQFQKRRDAGEVPYKTPDGTLYRDAPVG